MAAARTTVCSRLLGGERQVRSRGGRALNWGPGPGPRVSAPLHLGPGSWGARSLPAAGSCTPTSLGVTSLMQAPWGWGQRVARPGFSGGTVCPAFASVRRLVAPSLSCGPAGLPWAHAFLVMTRRHPPPNPRGSCDETGAT